MKRFVSTICVSFLFVSTWAQCVTYPTLPITTSKTTTLIFPTPVKRGDIGTKDILAQQVKENENILFVKAARSNFNETNLNVVTADGKFYTFTVIYDSAPERTVFNISPNEAMNTNEVLFSSQTMNPASIESVANSILLSKRITFGVKDNTWNILAKVNGIYIEKDVLFFQLVIENYSEINYDIDYIRFFITDKKTPKRTATQQQELQPLFSAGNNDKIKANSKSAIVFAFKKFTIPEAKSLIIQIGEKNGGRNLRLKVSNNKIVEATPRCN